MSIMAMSDASILFRTPPYFLRMSMSYSIHDEPHLSNRSQWLRAAVLGANDGLISTASLLVGVAAANASSQTLLLT